MYIYSDIKAISIKAILVVFLVWGLSACSFDPITKNISQTSYESTPGDSLMIYWSFNNADRVFVDGLVQAFEPIDSTKILPERSHILKVWAYKGNLDSLVDRKYIRLIGDNTALLSLEPEIKSEIIESQSETTDIETTSDKNEVGEPDDSFVPVQRGPVPLYKEYQEVRGAESEYFRGVTNSNDAVPHTVKISSIISERDGKKLNTKIRFLVLDKYGNFLDNDVCDTKQHCELKYSCNDRKYSYLTLAKCKKEYSPKRRISNDISILLDNSVASSNYQQVFDQLKNLPNELAQNDRAQIVRFNHKSEVLCDFADPYSLKSFFSSSNQTRNNHSINGLSSVYKSIYETLQQFPERTSHKALILITHFNDNSSLIYKVSDLIEKSKEKNIPIYIIAVGNTLLTSHLNYIATTSGGAFYHLFSDETKDISNIINEIYFSMNNYFEVEFTDNNFPFNDATYPIDDCDDVESLFSIDLSGNTFVSQANIFAFELPDYFQFQALALFDEQSIYLVSQYNDNLDMLATTMLDNPNYKVEIIGHTGNEGSDKEKENLSKKRANAVIDYLISKGIPSDRLIPKAMGYRKPLYYRTNTHWQESLNRRVELRWLDPSKLPYEIIAEVLDNESQAKRIVSKWQRSNMRAYYERVVIDNELKYQVKLWGYKTVIEANQEIKRLKPNNPNTDFRVE